MNIPNVRGAKRAGERVRIELRVAARFRDGADIQDLGDAMRSKELDKLTDGARGMADGEDSERLAGARHFGATIFDGSRCHTAFTNMQFHHNA